MFVTKRRLMSAWIVLFLVLFCISGCRSKPETCMICDREIHPGMATTIMVKGKTHRTCCVTCALTYQAERKGTTIKTVVDYPSNRQIDPQKAAYIRNSDVEPCSVGMDAIRPDPSSAAYKCFDRCRPSIIAFANQAVAASFQTVHGGELLNFTQLENTFLPKQQ